MTIEDIETISAELKKLEVSIGNKFDNFIHEIKLMNSVKINVTCECRKCDDLYISKN